MLVFINFLTILRILLGVVIFLMLTKSDLYLPALIIFFIAGITDYFDGYLARKYQVVSTFGEILDPIADKVLITFSLIGIAIYLQSLFIACLSAFIIAREIWVSGLRDYNSSVGNLKSTEVTFLAKIKTTLQIATICFYLVGLLLNQSLIIFLSDWILFIATLITIKTGLDYSFKTNIFGNSS